MHTHLHNLVHATGKDLPEKEEKALYLPLPCVIVTG